MKYNFETELFSEINKNINTKLIYSFRKDKLCHYDEEELVLGVWDGTIKGCSCDKLITENECSEKLINQGCNTIPSCNPKNYTVINSHYICIKKSSFSYSDLLLKTNQIIDKGKDCQKNYKSCGIIDTLGRKFCVKEEEICPINKNSIEANEDNDFGETYDNIPLRFNPKLDYLNNKSNDNSDEQILSIFRLNQKEPCIYPIEKYWDYHYILEEENKRCTKEIKSKYYDDRYLLLSNFTTNKYDLYKENAISEKISYIDDVSLDKIKNDKIYFFGRNFIGFDKKELKNYDYDKLISKQNLSNILNFLIKLILFFFVAFVLILLVFLILKIINVKELSIASAFSIKCDEGFENLEVQDKIIIIKYLFY